MRACLTRAVGGRALGTQRGGERLTRAVQAFAVYPVSFTAPGATLFSWTALDPASGPIAPVVGPVQAPRVNAADAFAPQVGVGLQRPRRRSTARSARRPPPPRRTTRRTA